MRSGWIIGLALMAAPALAAPPAAVRVGPAAFKPMYPAPGDPERLPVAAFLLDDRQVTNGEFLAFVNAQPGWRRDQVADVRADKGYLSHWAAADDLGPPGDSNRAEQPVTRVSWYAAKAYCAARGARLPTELEWETAAAADGTRVDARDDPKVQAERLSWYAQPTRGQMRASGSGPANRWGARDLHGLVWEWVYDYNGTMVTGDNREGDGPDTQQFCGSGAISAADGAAYAAFMRYALRGSLGAAFTLRNLGFRCAQSVTPKSPTKEDSRK